MKQIRFSVLGSLCILAAALAATYDAAGSSPYVPPSDGIPLNQQQRAASPALSVGRSLPEPGPENRGLKMRLAVVPNAEVGKEGYAVQIDILNVTDRTITLQTAWPYEETTGNIRDYIEASVGIESYPAMLPWSGGVRAPHRTSPQTEYLLKAGESLSVRWSTEGRHLKNKVIDPYTAQNPEFAIPGLYSIHAIVSLLTPERRVFLRSNEALVPMGGSRELPKHTFGRLSSADSKTNIGSLSLGSIHKVESGDQFLIGGNKEEPWKLTVTEVRTDYSLGRLEPVPLPMGTTKREPRFPGQYSVAVLLPR